MSKKLDRILRIIGRILILVAGTLFANASKAQNREDVYIGIYKSTNLNESREISSRTTSPSKLIRWISTNEWIVGLGPYSSVAVATTAADEVARNYKSKTGQEFQYSIFRFRANSSDDQLTSQNIINSSIVQQQAATTSNTVMNGEWIKDVEFNGSKPGIRVHLLYGRMKRDGDLLQVSNLLNFYPNARGDENATEPVHSGEFASSSSPARSRLFIEIVNCKSSTVARINDVAYSRHWGEGGIIPLAFSSKVDTEPVPFGKDDIDLYKKVCSISNLPQDKSLSQQWKILESNAKSRNAESLSKIKKSIQDTKYGMIQTNNEGTIIGSCKAIGNYLYLILQPIAINIRNKDYKNEDERFINEKEYQYLINYSKRVDNMVRYISSYENKDLLPSLRKDSYNSYLSTMELVNSTSDKNIWVKSWNFCAEKIKFEKINISSKNMN
jgi:hypothetical protein